MLSARLQQQVETAIGSLQHIFSKSLSGGRMLCRQPMASAGTNMKQVELMQQSDSTTARQVAAVAGLLMSFKPAMAMAPLYTRDMFTVISAQAAAGWDSVMQRVHTAYLQQELEWWQQNVRAANGKRWYQQRTSMVMASDASESRYAAYQVDAPAGSWRMEVGFTTEELALQAANQLHSTLREIRAIRLALETLAAERADLMRHSTVQWFSDSQAGVALLRAMKGDVECLREIRRIYRLAMELDLDFSWEWKPRDHPMLKMADEYSKDEDVGDVNVTAEAQHRLQQMRMHHPRTGQVRR